jgi:signal peptidase II
MRFLRLFLPLTGILLVIDQMVKWWSREAAQHTEGRSILPLWPGVFELKLVYNHGVAFGLFQGAGVLFAPVAALIAAAAAWYSFSRPNEPTIHHLTASLLAAGAVGNLIDRLTLGKVTDMFWIRLIDFPVFNVADVCITAAGALLFIGAVRDSTRKDLAQTKIQPSGE